MAIVSFEMIERVEPSRTRRIGSPSSVGNPPVGPIDPPAASGSHSRTTAYDPDWGYFTFGQDIAFETDPAFSYQSEATFTIDGVFSVNAERALGSFAADATEEAIFNVMANKLTTLENIFKAAAETEPPSNAALWYTSPINDPRVLHLPLPLVDRNGDRICALPESIEVRQTRWPVEIAYQAVLREARPQQIKGLLSGTTIDKLVLSIDFAAPIMRRHRLVGSAGEMIHVMNYQRVKVGIEGQITNRIDGATIVQQRARDLVALLAANTISLSATARDSTGAASNKNLFGRLYPTQPTVDMVQSENAVLFSVQGFE